MEIRVERVDVGGVRAREEQIRTKSVLRDTSEHTHLHAHTTVGEGGGIELENTKRPPELTNTQTNKQSYARGCDMCLAFLHSPFGLESWGK